MGRLACLLTLLVALLAGAVGGCSKGESSAVGDAGVPVDPVLLAFLSRARSAHHIADQHEEAGRLEQAVDPLQRLVDGPVPGGNALSAPAEVREVMADTLARLADLKSQLGRQDAALQDVERGLQLAKETTYFRGHLFEIRGLVEERLAKSLEAKGEKAAAEEAKKRALDAAEKSMAIQAEVIEKATAPGAGR
jgi:tetratricopeptide (TPR) repeat protein